MGTLILAVTMILVIKKGWAVFKETGNLFPFFLFFLASPFVGAVVAFIAKAIFPSISF